MSKTIALFPGQGAQYVGMGKALAEESPAAKAILEQADDVLGFSLSKMMFDGPEEDLKFTANTQPALYVCSMMVMELVKEKGVSFDMVAGHSLGEYSAICAAGGFSFEDGLKLVRKRGELMGSAGEKQPGAMSAVIGKTEEELAPVLEEASQEGIVVPANFNGGGQIVISGSVEGVKKAGEILTAQEVRVVPLPVSGAFHSPLMEFALEGLKEKISETQFNDLKVPLMANVTSSLVSSGEELKDLLVKQLVSPVRWEQSMFNAVKEGVSKGLELGSGKVLMGLMRRIDRKVKVFPVESMEALEKAIS
jgi:[acyl-carrier-protein] S-malonyltransferase